ncbi:MAG TPA: hypothetical protein VLH39_02095, partial [Magnetospirillaceae bacterium]|nr:hypothetical protein [Magnetospirillaceae bacterium]
VRKHEARLRPGLSLAWGRETAYFPVRCGAWRRCRAFDLYAGGLSANPDFSFHRLLPSPVPVRGALPLPSSELPALFPPGSRELQPPVLFKAPDLDRRKALVREVLESWRAEAEAALAGFPAGRGGFGLANRIRILLYALGDRAAAPFLAESARGVFDAVAAGRALEAVRGTLADFRRLVP